MLKKYVPSSYFVCVVEIYVALSPSVFGDDAVDISMVRDERVLEDGVRKCDSNGTLVKRQRRVMGQKRR